MTVFGELTRTIDKTITLKPGIKIQGGDANTYLLSPVLGVLALGGNISRSPGRCFFEELFPRLPVLNANIGVNKNLDFEVLGTNATAAQVTNSATEAGIVLTTAGADNDQTMILPHLDAGQTAWTTRLWGTENQVVYECQIRTGVAIATELVWVGLKLTNTPVIATDADQIFFRYSTDDSDTTWRIISSIGGVDTNTDSGVTVAVSTLYNFKIVVDSDRIAKFYINDVLVKTTTALTNDVDLIPYVGLQALSGVAKNITLCYEKISRVLFE